MPAVENLKFRLECYATWWKEPPAVDILIDNELHYSGQVTGTEENPTIFEFTHKCHENEDHQLIINRWGKRTRQTIIDEQGNIIKDQILHLKSIQIDEIDIGSLIYRGEYTPRYPEPWASQQRANGVTLEETFTNVTKMGHNGQWKLSFASPFYIWLLENLY